MINQPVSYRYGYLVQQAGSFSVSQATSAQVQRNGWLPAFKRTWVKVGNLRTQLFLWEHTDGMKRTITLRVEVADADDYAAVVADIVNHPAIIQAAWTGGERIKTVLESTHGMNPGWAKGAGSKWVADNS